MSPASTNTLTRARANTARTTRSRSWLVFAALFRDASPVGGELAAPVAVIEGTVRQISERDDVRNVVWCRAVVVAPA